jgi:protein-S-isoprenylcysteine O-methyltransferase Ste14
MPHDIFAWVWLAPFVGAIWLLHRAHIKLGARWSPTVELKDDHVLVTDGV